ncbi:response regulator [Sulfurimonas sp.]|uniref:response regulator transcription factor n=1 Tax=Sulfurimonas sp. TaxID=2022749 RepID=UPI002AAFA32B|nr:response regulator [Sulfurimonas sp.]
MQKNLLIIDDTILEFMQSLTLLCIEDNKTTQLLYDAIFEDYVEKIIFADDGQDGYEKYDSNDIDVIITDYAMPKLNGLEMIEKIRKSDKTIPIILVTVISEADVIIQALNLNVNNFIKNLSNLKKLSAHLYLLQNLYL